ncbi:transposase [bacterium]|nr:transposase [bacterium]
MGKYYRRNYYQGAYYHIYNKGNAGQNIFNKDEDYIFYLKKVREFKERHKITVICYCLLPDHFHSIIRQDSEIPVSKFILSLHTSYVLYFNQKYERTGHLFQGRFQVSNIEEDKYLLPLSSYIHLNPIVHRVTNDLYKYPWSSYLDYIGKRAGTLCEKSVILKDKTSDWYRKFTEEKIKERMKYPEFWEKISKFLPRTMA